MITAAENLDMRPVGTRRCTRVGKQRAPLDVLGEVIGCAENIQDELPCFFQLNRTKGKSSFSSKGLMKCSPL